LINSPAGNPVAVNDVGLLVAVIVNVKNTFWVPLAVLGDVITEPAPVTVTATLLEPVPQALAADTIIVKPGQYTVPDMIPVVPLSVTPAGSPVAPQETGEVDAVI
jgi:hypothetical protein